MIDDDDDAEVAWSPLGPRGKIFFVVKLPLVGMGDVGNGGGGDDFSASELGGLFKSFVPVCASDTGS